MGHHSRILTVEAPPALAPRIAAADAGGVALAAVPGAPVQWLPLTSLQSVVEAWQKLAERALQPNVFYEPAFALPAVAAFGEDAGALLVWSAVEPDRLIGFFPGRIERRRYGFGPAVLVGWTHPYAPLGVPLIDRDEGHAAITGWLAFIATGRATPRQILLPYVAEGAFAIALRTALAARGGRWAAFGRHVRALLAPPADRASYVRRALPGKKRKELRRQWRRLGQGEALAVEIVSSRSEIAAALDDFMRLEARGWKGSAGTAALDDPAARQFMQRAASGLAERSQVQIACLRHGERMIAAAIILRSGAAAWFWKIAYDQEAARASPGVQLALELTNSLLADGSLTQVDSCATPDHPMIDHLWRERLELADWLIAPAPNGAVSFAATRSLEYARRRAIDAAKWLRSRWRGR